MQPFRVVQVGSRSCASKSVDSRNLSGLQRCTQSRHDSSQQGLHFVSRSDHPPEMNRLVKYGDGSTACRDIEGARRKSNQGADTTKKFSSTLLMIDASLELVDKVDQEPITRPPCSVGRVSQNGYDFIYISASEALLRDSRRGSVFHTSALKMCAPHSYGREASSSGDKPFPSGLAHKQSLVASAGPECGERRLMGDHKQRSRRRVFV